MIVHSLLEDKTTQWTEQEDIHGYKRSDSLSSCHSEVNELPPDIKHGNYGN